MAMKAKHATAALVGAAMALIAGNVEAAGLIVAQPYTTQYSSPVAVRTTQQCTFQAPVTQPKVQQTTSQAKPQQATTQVKSTVVQVKPQPSSLKPQQTVSSTQNKLAVAVTNTKALATTVAKPSFPPVQVSVQSTNSVDLPVVSVTKACDLSTQKCTKSISATALDLTVSVGGNGDICFGPAQKGGVGLLYGKVSETGCYNVKDGTVAEKTNVAGGVGLGFDALTIGSTIGVTVTARTKPDNSFYKLMTTGFPGMNP
jgi:hypothetical protein